MSTATLKYSEQEVERIIQSYLESRGITVTNVKLEVGEHIKDRPFDMSGPYFKGAVVEIDPGDIVANERGDEWKQESE